MVPVSGTESTVDGFAQVNAKPLLALIVASGAAMFCVITVAALVAEHPFEVVVPVTVYEPVVETFSVAAVPPLLQE